MALMLQGLVDCTSLLIESQLARQLSRTYKTTIADVFE
jgi:hypothetical protein